MLPSQCSPILVPCSLKPIKYLQPSLSLLYYCFISRATFVIPWSRSIVWLYPLYSSWLNAHCFNFKHRPSPKRCMAGPRLSNHFDFVQVYELGIVLCTQQQQQMGRVSMGGTTMHRPRGSATATSRIHSSTTTAPECPPNLYKPGDICGQIRSSSHLPLSEFLIAFHYAVVRSPPRVKADSCGFVIVQCPILPGQHTSCIRDNQIKFYYYWDTYDTANGMTVDLITFSHVPVYNLRPAAPWHIPYVDPHSTQNHYSSLFRRSAARSRPLLQPYVAQAPSAPALHYWPSRLH